MRRTLRSTTAGRLLLSLAAVGAAGSMAGLGTFATFTDAATADQAISTGTVDIALGASGGTAGDATNRLTVGATNVAPGDSLQRLVRVRNAGTIDFASITLTTTDETVDPDTVLTTDATNGLQVKLEKCSVAWVESGPPYTYACGAGDLGTRTTVLARRAVIGSNLALTGMNLTSASETDVVVTVDLPSTANNDFQNKSATIRFSFGATQRSGTNK